MNGNYEGTKTTPIGTPSTVIAVLLLALGSGFVVFVGVGLLAIGWRWPVRVALTGAGVASLLVLVLALARLERAWFQVEVVQPMGAVVPELPAGPVVQVELHDADRGRWAFADLPGTPEQLKALASGVLAGRTLSEGTWTGSGGLFTQRDFRALRGTLLERGLVCWRREGAPGQGVELTRGGTVLFQQLAELDARAPACARTGSVPELTDGWGRGV